MRGGVEADTVTSNKFIGDLEGNCSGIAGSVEWSNITNKPFTDGSQVELKEASDDVKEEYKYLDIGNASVSFIGIGHYNAIGIKLPSGMDSYSNSGKIIYTTGGTYESFTDYNGTTIPAGSVSAGYYKLGTYYGSFVIGSLIRTTVDFTSYYLGESYMVVFPNTFDGCSTSANKLSVGTVGSSTKPVYFNNGIPVVCNYSLGSACAKSYTDSSSSSAISTSTNLVTERDVYYGLPKINGSHTYNYNTNIYAPTSSGTSGYVLKSNGSGAPSWVNVSSIIPSKVQSDWNQIDSSADDYIKNRPVVTVDSKDKEIIYSGDMYSTCDSNHGLSVEPNNFFISSDIKYDASYSYYITIESAGYSSADEFFGNNYGTHPLTFIEGVDGMEAEYYRTSNFRITIVFLSGYNEIDIMPYFENKVPVGGNLVDGAQIHLELIRKKMKSVISEEYLPDSVKLVPQVTSEDEGKILKIVNGVPTWVSP